jgi:hypothetical protein
MRDYMEISAEEPIVMPQVGSDYWYVQLNVSRGEYKIQRCVWEGYTVDKMRYLTNYYRTEREAWAAADKLNALLKAMIPAEAAPIKHNSGRRKIQKVTITHPDVL